MIFNTASQQPDQYESQNEACSSNIGGENLIARLS